MLAAAACVPVMSVVPSISHDYKLVLYVFPLAVLVGFVAVADPPRPPCLEPRLRSAAWAMLQLSRSSLVIVPTFLNSKYAMIVLVQALLLFVSWRSGADPAAFLDDAAAVAEDGHAGAADDAPGAEGAAGQGRQSGQGPGAAKWLAALAGTAPAASSPRRPPPWRRRPRRRRGAWAPARRRPGQASPGRPGAWSASSC